jgi:hydroxymethylglutaryl-CoA lyase
MANFKIHEVGMRDGLQNESKVVPFEKKIEWIDKLIDANIEIVQIGSFVHPVRVPQMADTDKLFKYYAENKPTKPVILSGLVLNKRGYERALDVDCPMICLGVSASETHSMKNTGKSVDDALNTILESALDALDKKRNIQCSIQSAFGCGFEGRIDEEKVYSIARKYIDNAIPNISLADTGGHAHPEQVKRIISTIKEMSPETAITVHFHNTYGVGMANTLTAINEGADYLETAFAGLGGCPFTKVAAGNVCTEDLVHTINRMSQPTEIKINRIIEVAKEAASFFEKPLEGYVYKSGKLSY